MASKPGLGDAFSHWRKKLLPPRASDPRPSAPPSPAVDIAPSAPPATSAEVDYQQELRHQRRSLDVLAAELRKGERQYAEAVRLAHASPDPPVDPTAPTEVTLADVHNSLDHSTVASRPASLHVDATTRSQTAADRSARPRDSLPSLSHRGGSPSSRRSRASSRGSGRQGVRRSRTPRPSSTSRSRGSSVASLASSAPEPVSDDTDATDSGQETGLASAFGTLGAGVSMALAPEGNTDRRRNRARRDVTRKTREKSVRDMVREERRKHERDLRKSRYARAIVKLHPNYRLNPPAGYPTTNKVHKALKNQFTTAFTSKETNLHSFLNAFTRAVNDNELSALEGKELLSCFFTGNLRDQVELLLEHNSLRTVLKFLREFKTSGTTVEEQDEALSSWTLNKSEDIKSQILELYMLVGATFPLKKKSAWLESVKVRVLPHLPSGHGLLGQDRRNNISFGREMDIYEFADEVARVMKRDTPRKAPTSHAFEVKTQAVAPSAPVPTNNVNPDNSHLEAAIQSLTTTVDRLSVLMTSNAPKVRKPITFIQHTHADYGKASRNFRKDLLGDRVDNSGPPQFRVLPDRTVEPLPGVKMHRFNDKLGIFGRDPDTGRYFLTRAVKEHFKGRCATCGFENHRSSSPSCPMFHSVDSWQLCTKCHLGFHTRCSFNPVFLRSLN